jgi:hypothetical protein
LIALQLFPYPACGFDHVNVRRRRPDIVATLKSYRLTRNLERSHIMTATLTIDRLHVSWWGLRSHIIPIGFSQTGWNWVGWIGVVPC